jgi:hypothetical protein
MVREIIHERSARLVLVKRAMLGFGNFIVYMT